jgi:hypothetical protein
MRDCSRSRLTGMFVLLLLGYLCLPSGADAGSGSEKSKPLYAGLVFVKEAADICQINFWKPGTPRPIPIASWKTCPQNVFVSDGKRTIIVIKDRWMQEISVSSTKRRRPALKLPEPIIRRGNYWPDIISAGYLANGELGVTFRARQPGGASVSSLYGRVRNQWSLLEKKPCRGEQGCMFPRLSGRSIHDQSWSNKNRIWHQRQKRNPYYRDQRVVLSARKTYDSEIREMTFDINGKKSVMTYVVEPGNVPGEVNTLAVELRVPGAKTRLLTRKKCNTSLVDKYLLIRKELEDGPRLIDLETGNSTFGHLKAATWIN